MNGLVADIIAFVLSRKCQQSPKFSLVFSRHVVFLRYPAFPLFNEACLIRGINMHFFGRDNICQDVKKVL